MGNRVEPDYPLPFFHAAAPSGERGATVIYMKASQMAQLVIDALEIVDPDAGRPRVDAVGLFQNDRTVRAVISDRSEFIITIAKA